ncbi:uncharacterized protein LOC127858047 isoform X2 [Dreissena polymorpha]|uniref:uncharacterized protein LOC127858047 isoform X2 n=1 Tax=Dreissena polymorpha TaxID=45954 RepID=UPI0022650F8D|nr:uncharacterized protein LOC127858047 isoform X2 [Dreissena polymorpha]
MSGEEGRPMLPFMLSGRVTQVVDPHNFWMQLWTSESLHHFEQLQQSLEQFCEQSFSPLSDLDDLQEGDMVLVECSPGDQPHWRRGIITRIMSRQDSVDVIFIDYGYTEMTSRDHLCAEFPGAFKALPQQAVRCTLAGVVPISKSWTSRSTKIFQQLTGSKILQVLVVHYDDSYHYYKVALYPGNEDNAVSVSHSLMEEEVAMGNTEEEIPEVAGDVPAFMDKFLSGSSPTGSTSDKSDKAEALSPTKYTTTNCDKSPLPSNEKYIPPHVKNPGVTSGALPPGYEKQQAPNSGYAKQSVQAPNSGYAKQSVQQGYGANPVAFSTGYEKQPAQNSGYSQQPVQSSYGKPGPDSAYVKHSSESDKHGGSRQQTTPPRSFNYHGNYSRTPNKLQTSSAIEIKEKIANDFFPFDNVSVYPPSPVSPSRSPNKASLSHSNRQGQGSYFSRSPPGSINNQRINNNKPSGDENSDDGQVLRNGKREERKDTIYHRKPEGRSNFPPASPVTHTFEPSFMANKSNSATHPSPFRSPIKSDTRYINATAQGPPRLDMEAASGIVPTFYAQQPPRMHHHHHNTAMENLSNLPSVTKPELITPGYYQSHMNQPPINYLPPPPPDFNSPSPAKIVSFSHPVRSPNVPFLGNSTRNDQYERSSEPNYNSNINCDTTTDSKYPPPKNGLDRNLTRNEGNSIPNSGQNKRYNSSTTPTKYVRQNSNKWTPTTPDDEAIESFNFSEFDHTQALSKDHLNERVQREKRQALQEEAAEVERESKEQAKLTELARFGTRSSLSDHENPYGEIEDAAGAFDSPANDYTTNYEPKELEYVRYTTRKVPPAEHSKSLTSVPRHLADIDFSQAVKEVFQFTKQDGQVKNMKALLDNVFESLTKGCTEKQLCDVIQVLLSRAIKDYDVFYTEVMEELSSLHAKMDIEESLVQALKEQQELYIRRKKHGTLHINCARVTAHVYEAAAFWGEKGNAIQECILQTFERWIIFNAKGQSKIDQDDLYTECVTAFFEVSGKSVRYDRAFCNRIKEDLMQKILNESVSRHIRESLLRDIFLGLFTREVEGHDVTTQTPRKTMIPSSCQVKPATRDQGCSTAVDWQNEDYFCMDTETVATTTTSLAQSNKAVVVDIGERSSTPEPNISLRPRGRGRKSKPVSVETASVGAERSGIGHTYANVVNVSLDSSVYSNPSDSIYLTPNEVEHPRDGNETSDKSFSGEQNLLASFNQQTCIASDADDQNSASENGSTKSSSNSNKSSNNSNNSRLNGNEAAKPSIKETKEARDSYQERSIVDWFDFEPQPGDLAKTVQEKKLKTNVKLESATMNIIQNEMDKKVVSPMKIIQNEMDKKLVSQKQEHKTKSKKEKQKGRNLGEQDTKKTEKLYPESVVKESAVEAKKEGNAVNSKEGITEVALEENWDVGFRNENYSVVSENSENISKVKGRESIERVNGRNGKVIREDENVDKVKGRASAERDVSGNAKVINADGSKGDDSRNMKVMRADDSKDIDWWSDVEPQGLGVIPGVTSSCGIFTDNGPDVIIEDELEQDITGNQEDFDLNDLRAEAEKSVSLCDEIEINNTSDASIVFDQKGVATNFVSGPPEIVASYKDEFAFDVQDEWRSDEDDFELNGKADPEYEVQFPNLDLHSVIRNPGPYSVPDVGFSSNAGRAHQVSPSLTLAEYLPVVEAQVDTAARPRWVPGARRCFSCHQTDHTTDVCPNNPSILS